MMFENLQRAVDQLYDTCELDENRWQCEEVMLILDQAHVWTEC